MNNLYKIGKYADMRSDLAFKRAFGTEEYKAATIGLLQSILPELGIIDVKFINTELQGLSTVDRKGVIDVLCECESGEFVIEMQKAGHSHFLQRTVFYAALDTLRQSKVGEEWQYDLKDAYIIAFLNFQEPAFAGKDGYRFDYVTVEKVNGDKLPGSPEYHFFDLHKFDKPDNQCKDDVEKWLYLLRNSGELEEMPAGCEGDAFNAFEKAAIMSRYSPAEMYQYQKDMVTEIDRKLELKEVREKGLAEGRADAKQSIAKAMSDKGYPIAEIAQMTQLSEEEIRKLI